MLARPVGLDHSRPWNKGLLVGQKKPLQPKHVWSIRVRLEIARMWRDLALFNLAIDSKLRACDLVKLRVDEVCSGARIGERATVIQKKTGRPVQFEITDQTRASLKFGYERSERLALDISSRADFMHALTYPPDNMPDWCIAGLIASVGNNFLWYPFDAADEGHSNLSQDWQPSCCPAPTRPCKTGEHRPLSRD
jgi:hypothetical protein